MKSADHQELLRAIQALWEQHPDWRLGQLICNVAGWADVDVWDAEDGQLLAAIREQQEYRRSTGPAC